MLRTFQGEHLRPSKDWLYTRPPVVKLTPPLTPITVASAMVMPCGMCAMRMPDRGDKVPLS